MSKPPGRLMGQNTSFRIGADAAALGHPITVTIGRTEEGAIVELALVEGGKMGGGLQLLLAELGLKISRVLQDRDAETGDELGVVS